MIIFGAGMAGCLAGVMNPTADIFEAAQQFVVNHDAVLRFRGDAISKQVGIPFKKVKVHKGIFYDGEFVSPNIEIANMYSRKVTGGLHDRSIWNTEPSERFIAPSNFHEILHSMCEKRVHYGHEIRHIDDIHGMRRDKSEPIVSTIPMGKMLDILGINHACLFAHKPIIVDRYRVVNCSVNQTVYYPGNYTNIYRATLTGSDLIVERVLQVDSNVIMMNDADDKQYVLKSFNLFEKDIEIVKADWIQKYGKIQEIDDKIRKSLMYQMTQQYRIYSLGRFATWKNILLDDVLQDIQRIREMINMSSYDIQKVYGE